MTVADLHALDLSASLTVDDLELSIRFYTHGLGFAIDRRFESEGRLNGVIMRAGLVTLGLSRDDFAKGKDRVKGVGVALYLVTEQRVADVADRLEAAGFALDGGVGSLPWGPTGFTTRDPDGFRITIANPE